MAPPPLTPSPASRARGTATPSSTRRGLYQAYRQCRRRKRKTRRRSPSSTTWWRCAKSWSPAATPPEPFDAFLVEKPKPREIFAADFRDRVVHHLLVAELERGWSPASSTTPTPAARARAPTTQSSACRASSAGPPNGTRPAFSSSTSGGSSSASTARSSAASSRGPGARPGCSFTSPPKTAGSATPGVPTSSACRTTRRCSSARPTAACRSATDQPVLRDRLDQFVKHELKARFATATTWCGCRPARKSSGSWSRGWRGSSRSALAWSSIRGAGCDRWPTLSTLGHIAARAILVRRRLSVWRRRLAELQLRRLGRLAARRRARSPWPWSLLEEVHRRPASYRDHLKRASSHRLVRSLPQRYPRSAEYFVDWLDGVTWRRPSPRQALRLSDQKAWFRWHPARACVDGAPRWVLGADASSVCRGGTPHLTEFCPRRLLEAVKPASGAAACRSPGWPRRRVCGRGSAPCDGGGYRQQRLQLWASPVRATTRRAAAEALPPAHPRDRIRLGALIAAQVDRRVADRGRDEGRRADVRVRGVRPSGAGKKWRRWRSRSEELWQPGITTVRGDGAEPHGRAQSCWERRRLACRWRATWML